jgi:hypothetical protein
MGLSVCPAAIVAAPIDVVWSLVQPERLSQWIDGTVDAPVPEGPALVGMRFSATSQALGRNWHSYFTIEKVDHERHQLGMHVIFPFGMQLHEHLSCVPLDERSCRVQYG